MGYQGSHTAPPCAEKTIHYVASTPIELSSTALEMFKESLRVPDMMDAAGNVHTSNSSLENNRATQPLHGRPVFHYDYTNFNCPNLNLKNVHKEAILREDIMKKERRNLRNFSLSMGRNLLEFLMRLLLLIKKRLEIRRKNQGKSINNKEIIKSIKSIENVKRVKSL